MLMRRKDIDWLRLFGILLLFPFHTARVFDAREANYIENLTKSSAGETFMNVIWPWFMPLLFLIAGISTYFALRKRSGKEFALERVLRLLVPCALGIILIVPIQGYVARLQDGTLSGSYFNYLFYQFFPDFSDLSGYRGTFTPAHLWFILFLFIISIAVLPVCIATLRHRRDKGIGAFGRLFEKGWFLALLFIPLLISEALPDISGKNPFFYALYYMIGFFIASNENAWKSIDKIKWKSLILVAVTVPLFLFFKNISYGKDDFAWQCILYGLFRNMYGWSALLFMLAFAQMFLNRGGKVLDYLSQAAFPVYILHQSVMMVIAFFVVQWDMGVTGKFLIIMFATLAASIALYEALRHIMPFRTVLGIKRAKISKGKERGEKIKSEKIKMNS